MQLFVLNEEFLVSIGHQPMLIMSLPFVHTARRSYRFGDPVKYLELNMSFDIFVEVFLTLAPRGRRSRNKVSVGEPAEGSFECCTYKLIQN